ncbi:hypothetical protein [Brevibacillus laterosporus]|uniref:hypothetical protein n=1 Tax=Brevibacillus laterosporus TaxID=1465 RepID=UPI00264B62A9|nr:hypothetical protein [Brevibacillus laterosporus]MDN9010011.1 hypothetical protein [Brevibacillus laterosporus]MDO0940607.1 hypothetical protein [Brevibacillus laterosporus]
MTMVCGRPYVLFDPEQTAAIKRAERKDEIITKILAGLNQAVVGVDEYVVEYASDKELRDTLINALTILFCIPGFTYDEDVEEILNTVGLPEIEWKGDRGLI